MSALNTIRITGKGLRRFETGHPWIYKSDLLAPLPSAAAIVRVEGPSRKHLAWAVFSPKSQIALRILTRGEEPINREWFRQKILAAIELRKRLNIPSDAQRLFFGESDCIPAFVVDRFADVISFQTLCAGIDHYKEDLIAILNQDFKPRAIVERNDVPVRALEKLPMITKVHQTPLLYKPVLSSLPANALWREVEGEGAGEVDNGLPPLTPPYKGGEPPPSPLDGEGVGGGDQGIKTIIHEGDLKFSVDVLHGQKTGAYLDQRDNRILAGSLAYGSVLDCFSFEGWFAVHMARNAVNIRCVDSSGPALVNLGENGTLNNCEDKIETVEANCFDFLKEEDRRGARYDCINLDPPPFVKSARDKASGYRGYKEINLRAMKLLRPKGILITSSCSHHFSEDDFDAMIADAAQDAKVKAQIIHRRNAAPDHPILVGFPESNYLKCRILHISI